MVVYADVLIIINVFVTYFLLLCTKSIVKKQSKRIRIAFASLFGGFYSLILLVPNLPKTIVAFLNLTVSVLILAIAFHFKSVKEFLKLYLAFFLVNFIFAGFMFFIVYQYSPKQVIYQNGKVYFDVNFKTLLLVSTVCYILLEIFEKYFKRKAPDELYFEIELFYENRSVMTKAFLDTGNSVCDGFSGIPVVVAESFVCKKLLKSTIHELIEKEKLENKESNFKIRLIPYKDISNEGFLQAIVIDKIYFPNQNFSIAPVILAESKVKFQNDDYNALLNNQFIERGLKNEHSRQSKKTPFKDTISSV